ncbi:hypothetical protein PIB30_000217 [Stylosanthes scabra]|uniref:Uncharacterized protein n=1 Tax=Stylosanthes scabra TaxID=79078 RepID=A0ABU6S276_9FABA|nr:hypothetical protein [Stylosanthes scabra]
MDAIRKHDPRQHLVHEIERRVRNRRRMFIPIIMSIPKPIEIPTTAASAEASPAASSENTIVAVTKEKTLVSGVSGTVARQLALRSSFIPKKCPTRHPVRSRLHWRRRHRVVRLDDGRDLVGEGIGEGNSAGGMADREDAEAFRGGDCDGVNRNENVHHHRHDLCRTGMNESTKNGIEF